MDAFFQTLTWVFNTAVHWLSRFVISILAVGPIPQHVAFVMDGNRRYARSKNMAVVQGHNDGFVALKKVRQIYYDLQRSMRL